MRWNNLPKSQVLINFFRFVKFQINFRKFSVFGIKFFYKRQVNEFRTRFVLPLLCSRCNNGNAKHSIVKKLFSLGLGEEQSLFVKYFCTATKYRGRSSNSEDKSEDCFAINSSSIFLIENVAFSRTLLNRIILLDFVKMSKKNCKKSMNLLQSLQFCMHHVHLLFSCKSSPKFVSGF